MNSPEYLYPQGPTWSVKDVTSKSITVVCRTVKTTGSRPGQNTVNQALQQVGIRTILLRAPNGAQFPSVRCKSCRDNPPIKSNVAIATEFDRLANIDGLLQQEETTSCRNAHCKNYQLMIAFHPRHYRKNGQVAGYGQRYQCKACGCSMLLSRPIRLHKDHRQMAADVFSRIANKSPVRCTIRGTGLESNSSYYDI